MSEDDTCENCGRFECPSCGAWYDMDHASAPPAGWTEREWAEAVRRAAMAGDCPVCDHDAIRAAGERADVIGED